MKSCKLTAALTLLFCLFALPAAAKSLNVVASFTILGDIVREVAGDHVVVTVLVGPNGDAHTYEPSPKDAMALQKADLVFVNGLHFEPWMEKLIKASGYKGEIVVASNGVTPLSNRDEGDEHDASDAHAWQDLSNGEIYVRNIEAALIAADPAGEGYYRARGAAYAQKLAALDAWTRTALAEIPPDKRRVITTHRAFGYFSKAYGVTFLTPGGSLGGGEPSAGAMAALIRQVREEHIKALFVENMSDPRFMQVVARDTGAVDGGKLYSDALSPADGEAPTYEAMFHTNVSKLKAAMLKN